MIVHDYKQSLRPKHGSNREYILLQGKDLRTRSSNMGHEHTVWLTTLGHGYIANPSLRNHSIENNTIRIILQPPIVERDTLLLHASGSFRRVGGEVQQ